MYLRKIMKHFSSVHMELQFPSLYNLIIFLLFLYMVVKLVSRWKGGKNSNKKLPPGPWRLPVIGNMHQLFGSLPHRILRDLAKKHGPLMHLQLGEISTIVVSSPDVAKEVLITNGIIFAERPFILGLDIITYNSRDISMAPYGSYWRQLRKICTVEVLSAKRVQSFRSTREEEMSALVKFIASKEGSPINLTEKIFTLTSSITSKAAFGSKSKDQDAYISLLREFVKLATGLNLAEAYPSVKVLQVVTGLKQKYEKLFQQSDRVIQGILDDHKEKLMAETDSGEQAEEDLITTLLKLQASGDLEFPLTDIAIKALIWDMFSAGTETSSTALDWAMAEMLKNPRVMEKTQREVRSVFDKKGQVDETRIYELKYLAAVVKEALRMHPPLPLSLPRESGEKCIINGYEIPPKTRAIVNLWAIGRDPNYWNEPDNFLPERFLDKSFDFRGNSLEFIPFGTGRRNCPGISFALSLIELPLAQLLYHFDWNLPTGKKHEDLDMTEEFGIAMSRKDSLILVPTTYKL